MNTRHALILILSVPCLCLASHSPSPIDTYAIHEDGGIIYNPLTMEQNRTRTPGHPTADKQSTINGSLHLNDYELQYSLPNTVKAYDLLPLRYTLTCTNPTQSPIAIEASAYEDETRRMGRDLYDLNLPGNISITCEYLGSITGFTQPDRRHNLTPDFSDTPGEYPAIDRKPFVRSGVVQAGDIVWFKIRVTNSGDTILDSEGFGGCQLFPQLFRKDQDNQWQWAGDPYNLYYRFTEPLYPGESQNFWISFRIAEPGQPWEYYRIQPGQYKIVMQLTARLYLTEDAASLYWDGPRVAKQELEFTVEENPRIGPVQSWKTIPITDLPENKFPRIFHTYEEFMGSFDCWQQFPAQQESISGQINVQVAPWTRHIVVKLLQPDTIDSIAIPVTVDQSSLQIKYKPNSSNSIVSKDGTLAPLFMSQTMACMRTNVQIGPYPEYHIPARIQEMMDCGINAVATTGMPWVYSDKDKPDFNYNGDALKYVLDVARQKGLWIEGWVQYPFDRATARSAVHWITGKNYENLATHLSGYGDGQQYISHAEPRLPEINSILTDYQFKRWGDIWYQVADGHVPLSVEDTRGWMRDDINVRFPLGKEELDDFHQWLRKKYENIDTINQTWGTQYVSIESIDPQSHVKDRYGQPWAYWIDLEKPFHDWNKAVEDMDSWRTDLRLRNYRQMLQFIRKTIPNATVCLRTEGGNILVPGLDPSNPNPHFRHAYYSQRRCGMIADQLSHSGIISHHSDYVTIPYTPSELRFLIRKAVDAEIIPAWLPYFNDMRDIILNDKYGNDYTTHYNSHSPIKGYLTHNLVACYPWFKILHEEGGIPGILWEDYQCCGFVTETQKREVSLFNTVLNEYSSGKQQCKQLQNKPPNTQWRKNSKACRSYHLHPDPAKP